jgi:hypothetical protein
MRSAAKGRRNPRAALIIPAAHYDFRPNPSTGTTESTPKRVALTLPAVPLDPGHRRLSATRPSRNGLFVLRQFWKNETCPSSSAASPAVTVQTGKCSGTGTTGFMDEAGQLRSTLPSPSGRGSASSIQASPCIAWLQSMKAQSLVSPQHNAPNGRLLFAGPVHGRILPWARHWP